MQKKLSFYFTLTDRFLPLLEQLKPTLLQQLQQSLNREQSGLSGSGSGSGEGGGNKIPGRPGVDYPDFKVIPVTDFSCENFILEGFYADTFTSCQVSPFYFLGSGCGSVCRAVASNTRIPLFKSHHWQNFIYQII